MKKFKKKTVFDGRTLESMTFQSGSPITCQRAVMAQQAIDAHAEIDRKERVIRLLRKQLRSVLAKNEGFDEALKVNRACWKSNADELTAEIDALRQQLSEARGDVQKAVLAGEQLVADKDLVIGFIRDDRQALCRKLDDLRAKLRNALAKKAGADTVSAVNERAIQSAESALHEKDNEIERLAKRVIDLTHEGDNQSQTIAELMEEVNRLNELNAPSPAQPVTENHSGVITVGGHNLNEIGDPFSDTDFTPLETELAERLREALQVQPTDERVWIDVKGNENLVLDPGTYEVQESMKLNVVCIAETGTIDEVVGGFITRLRLITRLSDFKPVSPKPEPEPLEVKVGKYQMNSGVGEILCVDGDKCFYKTTGGSYMATDIEKLERLFSENSAVFIGGGDDA